MDRSKRVFKDQLCRKCLKQTNPPEEDTTEKTAEDTTEDVTEKAIADEFRLLKPLSSAVHKSPGEGEALDRFLKRFVPCMGIFMDASFFTDLILPATQGNEQVFNAACAVTAFHDLPINDIWADMPKRTYERYQVALKWYRRSLKQSIDSPPNKESPHSIALSLLTITLYLGIELRYDAFPHPPLSPITD